MTLIKYNITSTENGYVDFGGNSIEELKEFLYSDGIFKDCCGTIDYENNDKVSRLSIAALEKYGVYLGYADSKIERLSLFDKDKLNNALDVWGDGLYVSEGLFIKPETAWKGICEFVATGNMYDKIEWITGNDIPEGGNFII